MINIEYRHSAAVKKENLRRGSEGMEKYLSDLVNEMKSAKISASYTDSAAVGGEENKVLINGTDVRDILTGLKIVMPESDDLCDDGYAPKMVTFGRPVLDWNKNHIEDIPDVLMKNAISKVYSELTRE